MISQIIIKGNNIGREIFQIIFIGIYDFNLELFVIRKLSDKSHK